MEKPVGVSQAGPESMASALLAREGFTHAFFTRRGGVSEAPWDTLSFAASVGDDPAHVRENIARAAASLGVAPERVYMLSQVHGVTAHEVSGDEDPREVVRREGDVLVSRTAAVACGVRSADCVPILVADPASGAVAAIHSGWRGTVANAAAAGVAALLAAIGVRGEPRLVAAIGPHIEACSFEVGEDVAAMLGRASTAGESAVLRGGSRPCINLRRIVRAQLEAAGLRGDRIDDVGGCTVCDAYHFFSHRRDAARSGRLLSAIVARGKRA